MQRLASVVDRVDNASNTLQKFLKQLQDSFVKTVSLLLSNLSLRTSNLSFNDFRHMGEAFSFMIAANRGDIVVTTSLKNHFQFSREREMQTSRYPDHVDLAKANVFRTENAELNRRFSGPPPDAVVLSTRSSLVSRRIVDSEDDDDDAFQMKLKKPMPSAAEDCILPNAKLGSNTRNVDPQKLVSDSKTIINLADSVSIHDIKRQLCANVDELEAHLETVEMEMVLENPAMAYKHEHNHTEPSVSLEEIPKILPSNILLSNDSAPVIRKRKLEENTENFSSAGFDGMNPQLVSFRCRTIGIDSLGAVIADKSFDNDFDIWVAWFEKKIIYFYLST
jgi:hypothetical protein